MNNGHIYFEIQVDNPKRAIRFYTKAFGWRFVEVKGLPVKYWRIDMGGTGGGLLKRHAKAPAARSGANAYICSFEVADFDKAVKVVMKLGGAAALPRFAVRGRCRQGYFIDTEGNTFGLFEVDPQADHRPRKKRASNR